VVAADGVGRLRQRRFRPAAPVSVVPPCVRAGFAGRATTAVSIRRSLCRPSISVLADRMAQATWRD